MAQFAAGQGLYDAMRHATRPDSHILEIGPGGSPAFRRRDHPLLKVSDWCDSAELRRQLQAAYQLPSEPVDMFDDIDYVCADSRLAAVVPEGQRFDLIFSSHNIEHQPDLLEHLCSLQTLLAPGGAAVLVVPYKLHTFDVFRQPTTTSDVLMGHFGPPGWTTIKAAFDAGSHSAMPPVGGPRRFGRDDPLTLGDPQQAFARFQALLGDANPAVGDQHHHVFTPTSLRILLLELYMLRLCTLTPVVCTGAHGNSFLTVLQPTPWPDEPAGVAAIQEQLQAQRLALYRTKTFETG